MSVRPSVRHTPLLCFKRQNISQFCPSWQPFIQFFFSEQIAFEIPLESSSTDVSNTCGTCDSRLTDLGVSDE